MATSDSALPVFAIVVLSIMATAFLLIGYFTFVTKCCSYWHHLNPLTWLSILRPRHSEDPFIALSPATWNRGLDESLIREIPTLQFVKGEDHDVSTVYGCVVCLTEFQQQDMLKVLPKCSHAFHLDCIDIWLQSNANCPLCRSSISGTARPPLDHIVAPSSSPQDSQLLSNMGSDEDFVVIELGGEDEGSLSLRRHEPNLSGGGSLAQSRSHSARKMEQKIGHLKSRKWHHVSIMGDECIDTRKKDEQFCIQPLRRSFSMDSANDRQVYLEVQAITQQSNRHQNEASGSEDMLPLENEV
ncbi:hypothetical protein K1719_006868 [Acacia pycnantha]|nr:hypothetical protein K1719_006868 [Acacia pycnantha]